MAEPGRLVGQAAASAEPDDIDADGEYEMDDVQYEQEPAAAETPHADGHTTDAEGSEVDAEGDEVDDDEVEAVGAVKIATRTNASSDEEEDDDNDQDAVGESESDAKTYSDDDESGSSEEEEEEAPWQAESEEEAEAEVAISDPNVCIYCNQTEENDPSPEYEEYLSCVVCGDNSHRQCARDANTLSPEDDAKQWRCSACIQNDLHIENEEDEEKRKSSETLTRRRLSSVPRLARDLLPSARGVDPSKHSIFKELILPDDAPEGTRSLRKRKASHEEEVAAPAPVRQSRKKRRPSEVSKSEAAPSVAPSSPRPSAKNVLTDVDDTDGDAQNSASDQEGARLRSSRARRSAKPQRKDKRPLVWIEESQGLSLIVAFHLANEKVQKIVTQKPKKKVLTLEQERQERRRERDRERRERNRRAAQAARESPEVAQYPSVQHHFTAPFLGFTEKEDETKSKPYGGVLSEADADTSKTYPSQADRKRFEDARVKAEEAWKEKQTALYAHHETPKPSKQAAAASKIKCVNFGGWEIETWHAAPYPEEYSKNRVLYICEFCLKYMNSDYVAWRHKLKCPAKHPPGDEIYRDGKYSFFEVDGRKNPVYCQNLCLLAKLFLGSKTLYYDVEPFLFYVMTENDNYGCHFVGYFSKEKRPSSLNNVSCILVLPIHMRKGYGQYLIEFSYLLTRVERKTGSPEKPLSDMGLVSYRKYWRLLLCEELLEQKGPISVAAISERTGMTPDDIVSALEGLRALVRDPVTKKYAFRLDLNYFRQYIEKCHEAGNPTVKPECLVWTPYVMGRFGQYEDGPALQTVQQRDEIDEDEKAAPEEGVQMDAIVAKANGTSLEETGPTADEPDLGPDIPREDSVDDDSPAPPSTGTPLANGSMIALAGSQIASNEPAIPPTRYEIFPPVPGQPATKRRPGRPFGARRRTSTPNRVRNPSLSIHTAPVSRIQLSPIRSRRDSPTRNGAKTPGTVSVRRTRSRLGESVTNGDDLEEGGAVKAVITNGRRSTRSSASSGGSPRVVINNDSRSKGKGKVMPVEEEREELEDIDADGDYDDEAEEEMDVDAEGEEDDDIVMAET
ncbi:Histone acetyltransferase [Ascochyta rabiei]|uniref:Histone acetyltransferase n=1 Tax=Didymella rabiei TaxID=5454 RepID=A0A163FAE6_DIDRA|nr:Histone acetyltransferase [Ascochyta rabiei]KZM24226.1 transferase [Ascochyta rabiei]UPX15295.1 Histone acetyltransferase [Ascochyta rabiei]